MSAFECINMVCLSQVKCWTDSTFIKFFSNYP